MPDLSGLSQDRLAPRPLLGLTSSGGQNAYVDHRHQTEQPVMDQGLQKQAGQWRLCSGCQTSENSSSVCTSVDGDNTHEAEKIRFLLWKLLRAEPWGGGLL